MFTSSCERMLQKLVKINFADIGTEISLITHPIIVYHLSHPFHNIDTLPIENARLGDIGIWKESPYICSVLLLVHVQVGLCLA